MKHFTLLIMALILASCAGTSTSMQSSWQNPSSSVSMSQVSKVLVVAMTEDQAQRRNIEDAFVSRLGSKAMPSYAYFKKPITQINQNTASDELAQEGFNGAIVLRLADHSVSGTKRKSSVSVNPSLYYGFGSNLSAGVGVSLRPGYDTRKDKYSIETSVYDFPKDELIWSGVTLATNPNNINTMSNQLADEVLGKMRSDGFLK